MDTLKARDGRDGMNAPTKSNLDNRYGKIGISAVAGAVGHKPESNDNKPAKRAYSIYYDLD